MCGVFGSAGDLTRREWQMAHRLLVELAAASEKRGTDAAGFAALTSRGELLWQRQPGPAGALFRSPDFAGLRRRNIVMAIGHARLATTGAPAVNGNNHPHLAGDWAVVHYAESALMVSHPGICRVGGLGAVRSWGHQHIIPHTSLDLLRASSDELAHKISGRRSIACVVWPASC